MKRSWLLSKRSILTRMTPVNKKTWITIGLDALLLTFLLWFDQFTKHLTVTHLKGHESVVLIPKVLELTYVENYGAAFGILKGQKVFLLLISFVFVGLVLWFLYHLPKTKKFKIVHVMLIVLLAGGIGNMIDRFKDTAFVVDFISFVLINFPVFNFADICITCSTIGLFIMFAFFIKEDEISFWKSSKRENTNG